MLWIWIYHSGSAPKIISIYKNLSYFPLPFYDFLVYVNPKSLLRELELITFTPNSSIKSEYFFPRGSNWRFFPLSRKLLITSMCISKIKYLLCIDCEILNMGFFFHKQYGIFILKRLPPANYCCFKANETIKLEPKRMKYFIFSAPEYFC